MSRMCDLMVRTAAVSDASSRSSTIRPPSGKSSNTCLDVYWSTPMTVWPRRWTSAKAVSLVRAVSAGRHPVASTIPTDTKYRRMCLELELPVLSHQSAPEHLVWFFLDETKSPSFIYTAGGVQNVVGPQTQSFIPA